MTDLEFEIKSKDIGARIGKLTINGKTIETPTIMPVYSLKNPVIGTKELKEKFNANILMANAYSLLRDESLRKKTQRIGIHKLLKFDGLIATDSGSYQLMNYGGVETNNAEIIEFEEKIKTDIGSFLDIPTLPDSYKPRAAEELDETLKRAHVATNAKFVVNAGIQGGKFLDLRKKAARELGGKFEMIAIGGIVPLMEKYRFKELIDIICVVKKNIPTDRVVHAFGLGHPMVFSIAVALGVDLFDSAAYVLYAADDRYLTEIGTKRLADLKYLPCSCPVCSKNELGELVGDERVGELARHNLYITLEELRRTRQAIKDNSLWEYLSVRCRSHPALLEGLKAMLGHTRWLATLDRITKKSAFYDLGFESKRRTECINVRQRVKRVTSRERVDVKPFGKVPIEILDIYPFNFLNKDAQDLDKVKRISEYQFGEGAGELFSGVVVKRSRTGRIRWIYKNKELFASVRASDHFVIPKRPLAVELHKKFKNPRLRVVVTDDDEAIECVSDGKSVFAKFVEEIDPNLRAGDEVLVVDGNDSLITTGKLVLSPTEVMDFNRGVAVKVR